MLALALQSAAARGSCPIGSGVRRCPTSWGGGSYRSLPERRRQGIEGRGGGSAVAVPVLLIGGNREGIPGQIVDVSAEANAPQPPTLRQRVGCPPPRRSQLHVLVIGGRGGAHTGSALSRPDTPRPPPSHTRSPHKPR